MESSKSTFALLSQDLRTIVEVRDLTDDQRDALAAESGRRLVYLPMGGEEGDSVEVDDDGEATVISARDIVDRIEEAGADLTSAQICALRDEAGSAGDDDMVAICDAAIAGDVPARACCAQVIEAAEAQADD